MMAKLAAHSGHNGKGRPMNTNFVEELRWRGMLHDIMPETEELLTKEMVGVVLHQQMETILVTVGDIQEVKHQNSMYNN